MGLKEIIEHHVLDHIWSRLAFGPLSLPISKHLLMMGIASLILLVVFPLLIRSRSAALAPFRAMVEVIFLFIRDEIVLPNLGPKGAPYMGYFATLFFFILVVNLIGLVPYGATATGNLAVTGGLARSLPSRPARGARARPLGRRRATAHRQRPAPRRARRRRRTRAGPGAAA